MCDGQPHASCVRAGTFRAQVALRARALLQLLRRSLPTLNTPRARARTHHGPALRRASEQQQPVAHARQRVQAARGGRARLGVGRHRQPPQRRPRRGGVEQQDVV
jgi:hypothetical protein